jgi:hypothetical protein
MNEVGIFIFVSLAVFIGSAGLMGLVVRLALWSADRQYKR